MAISRSRVGVPDPVVEAAALERVVQVAGAVRGQHHPRPARGADGADLGDRHLEVGEQLEQERLELVVGAVDLVDQQHRRHGVGVLDRLEQRPPLQELARRTGRASPARGRAPPTPRACGCRAAGGRGSSRRARGRRRCPRSTAGGSGGRRCTSASAFAASVFPTPASPSRSTGFSSASDSASTVARPRSARYACSASWSVSASIETGCGHGMSVDDRRANLRLRRLPAAARQVDAAVDRDRLAGDVRRRRRRQIGDQVAHLGGASEPLHRHLRGHLGQVEAVAAHALRIDPAGRDAVERDAMPAPLHRERPRQRPHPRPGRRRVGHAGDAALGAEHDRDHPAGAVRDHPPLRHRLGEEPGRVEVQAPHGPPAARA